LLPCFSKIKTEEIDMNALENKIPPPIITVLFAFVMWCISLFTPALEVNVTAREIISLVILLLGVFFCIAGIVSFRAAKTTINPLKPEEATSLVSNGIYKITRNPMYVGFVLGLIAWSVYLSSPITFSGVILFIWYITRFQIIPEERALREIFSPEYSNYQEKVRRWL